MRADNTYTIISRIHSSINELILRELKKNSVEGIVPSHGSILTELFQNKELSMNELAVKIGKTPQTVTTLVKKLAALEYVEAEKCKIDRRSTMVKLTEKGRALQPVFMSISETVFEKQYEGMKEDEVKTLRRLLLQMESNFSD